MDSVAQILTSKNGKVIAGITGIVLIVLVDRIVECGYRISYNKENNAVDFEPASSLKKEIVEAECEIAE